MIPRFRFSCRRDDGCSFVFEGECGEAEWSWRYRDLYEIMYRRIAVFGKMGVEDQGVRRYRWQLCNSVLSLVLIFQCWTQTILSRLKALLSSLYEMQQPTSL